MSFSSIILIAMIPITLIIQAYTNKVITNPMQGILVSALLLCIELAIVFKYRGSFLKEQWSEFTKNKKDILISVVSAVVILFAVPIISKFFINLGNNTALLSASNSDVDYLVYSSVPYLLISSLIPTLVPFVEEVVFRYELYYKHRNQKINNILLALLSSVAFGLVHLGNYSYNIIQTIPIMLIGLFLSIIYTLTKNIWTPIIAHMIYNGSMTIVPAIILIIAKLIY